MALVTCPECSAEHGEAATEAAFSDPARLAEWECRWLEMGTRVVYQFENVPRAGIGARLRRWLFGEKARAGPQTPIPPTVARSRRQLSGQRSLTTAAWLAALAASSGLPLPS